MKEMGNPFCLILIEVLPFSKVPHSMIVGHSSLLQFLPHVILEIP
jgi:hypothetical protein